MLRLKVTPVVGLPQFTGWSQVAESTASVSVRLILVFAISGKHAGNIGRDISEKISDFYFYDVEQLHDFLNQLVEFSHAQECKIYFSCAVLGKNKSVFATYGGSVFLKRNEKSGKILTSEVEIKIVEGSYVENDVFVLTTLQADQFLNEVQLKFNQGYDTDIIITSVVPGLHAQEDSSLSALVFINKDDEESIKQEKPFIEIEDEFEEDVVSQENHLNESDLEEISLADVQVEVQDVKLPSSFEKIIVRTKHFFLWLIKKIKYFLFILFLFIKKILASIWNFILKINLKDFLNTFKNLQKNGIKSVFSNKKEYLLEMKPKKGLWKFVLAATLILIVLVVAGYLNYQRNMESQRIQDLLKPIQTQVELAKQKVLEDPIYTREVISNSIKTIANLEQENKESNSLKLLTQQKQDWTEYLGSISGIEELQELDIFYDLRLAKSDFISTGIDIDDETLVLFDKDMKQVLLLDYTTKKVSIRDFSEKDVLKGVVIKDDTVFTLTDGIYKFSADIDADSDLQEVRALGDSNKDASLIAVYDRFVYVVNPDKRNIYRYSQGDDGYSDPVGWIKSATGLKYDELTSISVDGDVWLTTINGQLKKFASGREETLNIRGLEVPFENEIYAYTNENQENVYVLDPTNNRIVSFSKNGDFIKEYKSVSLGAASNVAVSEALNKIFVVSGSIVYQIEL